MKKPNWLVIERPQFNRSPKFKLSFSKYCYLFPTGCGNSKSLHQHTLQNEYTPDVYKCQAQWVTSRYRYFFLWLRLDISVFESTEGMGSSLMQKFKPADKSKTTIDQFLNQIS